jgi:cobalamin biosynthesis protein CobD/CbiB
MSVSKILIGGVVLGVIVSMLTFALHLLNQPSDMSVWAGYLILLVLLSACAEAYRRLRKNRSIQKL